MTEDLTVIKVDEFLPQSPSRVWQALTDPELMKDWLMPNDFKPVVGHRFSFTTEPIEATNFSGSIACQVLEIRPEELISYSWTDPENPAGSDWVITWTLRPEGRGTRLFLEHSGFDPDDATQQLSRKIMNGGWRSRIVPRLAEVLAA